MTPARLSATTLAELRARFSGEIVVPGDPDYDAARAVWNATVDRRPAVVARCRSSADVADALRFARGQDLPVAVRGGAHSYPGFSTLDDGVVIDLSPMRDVQVDPVGRLARAGGGALLADLDGATQAFGLACPSGAVSHTGVAGLTLGGGIGRLVRRHGMTIDNLQSVELVTADGELARANEEENAELFWGIRGAGANFGVVTSFEYRLHAVGPEVFAGAAIYPVARAHQLAALLLEQVDSLSDDVTPSVGLSTAPSAPPFPVELAGGPAASVGATHVGDVAAAERELEPFRALGPVADTFGPQSYLDLQRAQDERYAWGKRNYWKGLLLARLDAAAIDVLLERLAAAPSSGCGFGLIVLGGAAGRVPDEATAFSGRAARLWLLVEALWLDPAEDEAHFAWGRAALDAVRPYATSVNYVNDLGRSGDLRAAYGEAKYERLVALKRIWDADNVFRLNQNIAP